MAKFRRQAGLSPVGHPRSRRTGHSRIVTRMLLQGESAAYPALRTSGLSSPGPAHIGA
jgi:hypothetical protein